MIFRCFPFCFATLFLSVVFSHDAVAQIDFDFPEADVPVLMVYEYYTEAYGERRPTLLVYSDGRVVRPVTKNLVDDYEFTLSEQKFKDVLNKIFVEHDFETISDKAISEEIVSKRKLKRPSPSAFRVTANKSDSSHVVDFGNTWFSSLTTFDGTTNMDYLCDIKIDPDNSSNILISMWDGNRPGIATLLQSSDSGASYSTNSTYNGERMEIAFS